MSGQVELSLTQNLFMTLFDQCTPTKNQLFTISKPLSPRPVSAAPRVFLRVPEIRAQLSPLFRAMQRMNLLAEFALRDRASFPSPKLKQKSITQEHAAAASPQSSPPASTTPSAMKLSSPTPTPTRAVGLPQHERQLVLNEIFTGAITKKQAAAHLNLLLSDVQDMCRRYNFDRKGKCRHSVIEEIKRGELSVQEVAIKLGLTMEPATRLYNRYHP